MCKSTVPLDKPVFWGQAILDISKEHMYEFHYDYVKPKWGENTKLLFTDTDSLCYEIKTEDFYRDVQQDVFERFDTSNYPESHTSGILTGQNKKVLGMMKDEAGGNIITECEGIRAKCYATKVLKRDGMKKAKEVPKRVVQESLYFKDYKDCLFNKTTYNTQFNTLRSRKHEETTEKVTKVALSANGDKRFRLRNPRHETLAWGSFAVLKHFTT